MSKEVVIAVAKSAPPVAANAWLWLINHEAAWWVSVLTVIYLLSQIVWGWWHFADRRKRKREEEHERIS